MQTSLSQLLSCKGNRVVSIGPEATVLEAAKTMSSEKIGAILVMHDEKLVGILTERDVLNRVVSEGKDPAVVKVHDVMTRDLVVTGPHRTIREAMQIVTKKHLRHLPVVENGELLGMLSGGDLTRSIVAEEEDYIESLYEYMQGGYPG